MFKRPHSSKTTTPLRSSDLRKLREEISRVYPACSSSIKQLLPDSSLTGKATTHLDEPLTIYYSPHGPDPKFFRLGKGTQGEIVPTCYAFDLVPTLVPQLETAEAVVDNLQSGSALFTAGVSLRSLRALPDDVKPGQLVSIVVYDHPRTIVAVGHLAASKRELLDDARDKKGKAVLTLHARGDYLWESGSKTISAPLISTTASTTSEQPTPAKSVPSPPSPPLPTPSNDISSSLASTSISTSSSSSSSSSSEPPLTPSEVDTILHRALLLSISHLPPSSYPLPASSLYSSHILPNRPSSPPSHSTTDLKKSSYKKLTSLIKFAHKKGWLVMKEVRGECIVVSGNRENEDVKNLRGYKTVGMVEAKEAAANASGTTPTDGAATNNRSRGTVENETGGGTTVNEYLKPSGSTVKQILSLVPHSRPSNDLYPPHTLKTLFLSYLSLHSLVHPKSQKHLVLTPSPSLSLESLSHQELLVSVLLRKGETVEGDFKEGVMTKDEGFKRFVSNGSGFTEYWSLSTTSGSNPVQGEEEEREEEEEVLKGRPPVVRIQIKNVGKRQVTLVSNHENWSSLIGSSEQVAEELKHKSASSVSIQPLAGSAKKNQIPKVEIMCQGTHDKLVTTLLTTKGVPKKYIEVDLTKSKK